MSTGDCFHTAFLLVCGTPPDWEGDPIEPTLPGAKVVHGLPLGRGGEAHGKRYWHAWVETVRGGIPTVIDYSNGLRVVMPKKDYYRHGDIHQVWRFNEHQARALYRKLQHSGPWVRGWEQMGDE